MFKNLSLALSEGEGIIGIVYWVGWQETQDFASLR